MDRLKLPAELADVVIRINLHSNMDRLKLPCIVKFYILTLIYIPIWID